MHPFLACSTHKNHQHSSIRTGRWRNCSKQGKSNPSVYPTFLSRLWRSCSPMSRSYPLSTKLKYIHVCPKRIWESTAKRRESWLLHILPLVFRPAASSSTSFFLLMSNFLGRSSTFFEHEGVKNIAAKYNATPAQVILSWGVQRETVVIPKSENEQRLKDNITVRLSQYILPGLSSWYFSP